MKQDIIKKFTKGQIHFCGGVCFEGRSCALLFVPESGTSLLISHEYAEHLRNGEYPDELLGKMLSRGMAFLTGDSQLPDHSKSIEPNFFLIDMTQFCNFSCKYCLRSPEITGKRLSKQKLDEILDYIIDTCRSNHYTHISIQPWGGEPLLEFENVMYIHQKMKDSGIQVNISLETNGSLITPEVAEKLTEANISVGISIDGPREIHDAQRLTNSGKPTFEEVTSGIACLQKAGMRNIGSISVITKDSLKELEKILDFFVKQYPDMGIKLNPMHSPGRETARKMALEPEDMPEFAGRLIKKVTDLYKKGYVVRESRTSTLLRNLLCRSDSDLCHSMGCRGGRCMVIFDQKGDVYPCEMVDYPEEKITNIADHRDLKKEIEKAAEKNLYFKEKTSEKCRDCLWRYYCRGGCTSAAMYQNGKNAEINKEGCSLNCAMYQSLIELIVDDPELAFCIMEGREYPGKRMEE